MASNMRTYEVEFYTDADGHCPMDEFLDRQLPKHRAKIARWIGQLEIHGPNLPRPYADMLASPNAV
jgi:hypothetical protein